MSPRATSDPACFASSSNICSVPCACSSSSIAARFFDAVIFIKMPWHGVLPGETLGIDEHGTIKLIWKTTNAARLN